ncbi:MAG: hypothetical protein DRQ55_10575, partial [Planctomycetota bacterium]
TTWNVSAELGAALDPELHHDLALTLASERPGTVDVWWRAAGEPYAEARRVAGMQLVPDGQPHEYVWKVSGLRGAGDATDVRSGVAGLRFSFQGEVLRGLRLTRIELRSDLDPVRGAAGPPLIRVQKDFAFCDGVALPVGAALTAQAAADGADELRLLVGASGGGSVSGPPEQPVLLELATALSRQRLELRRDEPWRELRLPLPAGGVDDSGRAVSARVISGPPGAAALLGRVLQVGPAPPRAERGARPTLVLYLEDTLRADRLSSYGYARETDPHLAAVAREGALMERVIASANWTRPAMASVFTSLPPPAHGNRSFRDKLPRGLVTLAEAFAADGYLVLSFTSNYHAGAWAGLDQGVDLQLEPEAFGTPLAPDTRTAGRIHPFIEQALAEYGDLPLLLLVHSLDPHAPYQPDPADLRALAPGGRPPQGDGHTARSLRYDAEVLGNDHWLARLDEALSAQGLADDAILCFLSDHGEAFGEHGAVEHHDQLYQQELSVPWVLRWPGRIAPGTRIARLASHIDVAPTLAGLAGVPRPEGWMGADLSAALRGGPEPPPAAAFSESLRIAGQRDPVHELAVVIWPHKLVLRLQGEQLVPLRLFDLEADPGEARDILHAGDVSPARFNALVGHARRTLQAVNSVPGDSDADGLDPARQSWMREMGYLK